MMNMDIDNEILLFNNFKEPQPDDREIFDDYGEEACFGDSGFSLIYAWQKSFRYAFKRVEKSITVIEKGMDKNVNIILLNKPDSDLPVIISELCGLFEEYGFELRIDYVSDEEIQKYAVAASQLGFDMIIESNPDDSDYIYETDDFIGLEGKNNKGKRGDFNYLMRNYPDIRTETHSSENNLLPHCIKIFDSWCRQGDCSRCVYNCEKTAFLRQMEIFDENRHRLCVSFYKDRALSFAFSEVLKNETMCYYFQKNIKRIRG
ncbi:MAG: DUF2156 domain-containing protein, partial [Clostridiales bacterium]|nr:DUF2156 domain-containing protein [Clostridiales bacterium]